MVNFCYNFEIIFDCFALLYSKYAVAMCDLGHNVEFLFHLRLLLAASGNLC